MVNTKTQELYKERVNFNRVNNVSDKIVNAAKGVAVDLYERGKRQAKNYALNFVGLGYDDPLIKERVTYQNFKYLVERALVGDDLGLDVYVVPFESLDRENAWGLWKGRKVKIPKLKDIPRMLGRTYKRLVKRAYRGRALDEQVQDYIKLHEKMEAVTKPKNHELYEATLLKSLRDLANEGNKKAGEVYEGAMAAYTVRIERGDKFARDVERYYKWLEQDVQLMFGKPKNYLEVSQN